MTITVTIKKLRRRRIVMLLRRNRHQQQNGFNDIGYVSGIPVVVIQVVERDDVISGQEVRLHVPEADEVGCESAAPVRVNLLDRRFSHRVGGRHRSLLKNEFRRLQHRPLSSLMERGGS